MNGVTHPTSMASSRGVDGVSGHSRRRRGLTGICTGEVVAQLERDRATSPWRRASSSQWHQDRRATTTSSFARCEVARGAEDAAQRQRQRRGWTVFHLPSTYWTPASVRSATGGPDWTLSSSDMAVSWFREPRDGSAGESPWWPRCSRSPLLSPPS